MKYIRQEPDYKNVVIMDRGDYTSCTVNLHGATLTSWKILDQEMLFTSRQSHFSGFSSIRGGIQFAFPVLGDWNFGPRHGFARDLTWTLDEGPVRLESGNVSAMFSLSNNPYTHSLWSYKFKLYYKIVLYEKKLVFSIGVENACSYFPFEFRLIQHSSIKVKDVSECEIIGFKNCKYKDFARNMGEFVEDRDKVKVVNYMNRIYYNTPNEVMVKNTVNGGTLKIIKKRTRDVVLWNPWLEYSLQIPDLGDDEFNNFVCIEAGISKSVRIEPLSCWEAYQTFEYIEPEKEPIATDYYDLFNGYC